jgi:zinc protease
MTKLKSIALLCAIAGPWALVRMHAQDAVPTAESILERYVEVTGGKAAYEKHTTEILTGTVAFPEQGLTGRLTRYAAAPDKEYSVLELGPIGKIESSVSNGVAWEKSAILGPRVKSGDEKDQAVREARFNAPLEWRTLFTKVEFAGKEMVNGEDCYKVTLTPATGKPESQYFSIKSGLLLKTVATAVSPMGEVNVEVDVSDYKKFGGVLYPTRSRQKAGPQELDITVTNIKLNDPVPAQFFELPADIKLVLEKTAGK